MKSRKRILLVEDEMFIAICLEMELKDAGYDVCRRVATGEEAVTAAAAQPPDVILMDIRLAGEMDGIEAARQIQTHRDIPIIFMTGYSDAAIEGRAKQLAPLHYFLKPIEVSMLQPWIDSVERQ